MPEPTRILLVEDEAMLRKLWTTILNGEGFQVTAAASVSEALSLITADQYAVLITDLNVGEPGDGFTIASAIRRVHPQAVTIIVTGYPAFEAALEAIRAQVDEFLTKPAEPGELVACVRQHLEEQGGREHEIAMQRLSDVVGQHKEEIIQDWYLAVENNPEIHEIRLPREERVDHLPEILDEICRSAHFSGLAGAAALASAAKHGTTRRKQGYNACLLVEETRILRRIISEQTQKHLIRVDISHLLPDLIEIDERIDRMLRYSMDTFFHPEGRPEAA